MVTAQTTLPHVHQCQHRCPPHPEHERAERATRGRKEYPQGHSTKQKWRHTAHNDATDGASRWCVRHHTPPPPPTTTSPNSKRTPTVRLGAPAQQARRVNRELVQRARHGLDSVHDARRPWPGGEGERRGRLTPTRGDGESGEKGKGTKEDERETRRCHSRRNTGGGMAEQGYPKDARDGGGVGQAGHRDAAGDENVRPTSTQPLRTTIALLSVTLVD